MSQGGEEMEMKNIKVKLLPDFPVKVLITKYTSNGELYYEITIAEKEEEGK